MAKIRHNRFIDTVDEVISLAKDKGVVHLYAEDQRITGRNLTIDGKSKLHFGTCGYLGLEHHPALKESAIRAIEEYGTQFPMSKTYISSPLYTELEHLVETIFDAPVAISKNCTLAHLATIPIIIREDDAIILDHQVHASVQDVVQKMLTKGVKVEMIRHNNLEALEQMVIKLRGKHKRIWYMSDGVYSMYGDLAPIKEMVALSEKYEELYLYVDDAHGTSWAGQYGGGYVMSQLENGLPEKMILTASMGKAFGACGGITVFPNLEWRRKVKTFGGPNTFSVQMEPPTLGAAIASAKLHLSDEIIPMQQELQRRIKYCNYLISQTNLPLAAESNSPVFFIATGIMAMTNDFVHGLMQNGVYVNPALFPAVPAKNNGARFTISLNNQLEDIEQLVETMDRQFPISLKNVGLTQSKIRKAFKMPDVEEVEQEEKSQDLNLEIFDTINKINKEEWDNALGHRGMFDYAGIQYLERSYSGNELPESNYDFKYYVVRDEKKKPILMTFCAVGLFKEDTFSEASISKQLEEIRKTDRYHLTSTAIVMGSLFTEGDHLFLDKTAPKWKDALALLMQSLYKLQDETDASNIILRDLPADDQEVHDMMLDQGFVKLDMPLSCVIENLTWENQEEFIESLNKRNKKHFRQDVKKQENWYDVRVESKLSEEELRYAMQLFQNVKNNNFAINSFDMPEKIFYEMNEDPAWEFILLSLKPEVNEHNKPISMFFCHKNSANVYSGMLAGMDYNYSREYGAYRQVMYQTIKRGKELGCKQVNMGISADVEKKKFGAVTYPRVAYVNAKDNFAMESIARTMIITNE